MADRRLSPDNSATGFGLLGLATFIIAHELCDFSWLGFVSIISNRTAEMRGDRAKKILTATSISILLGLWSLLYLR